jgi:hypothetical protein
MRNKIMNTRNVVLSAVAAIALCVPAVYARPQSGSSAATGPESIAQRKDNQQDRIAQGIDSNQLTAGETKNLETKEADLNSEEKTMRSDDNGHLTAADRTTLDKQQNHLSNQIYTDKHNANTAHYGNNFVGDRRENQQDRIAQGVKSGQLTAGETAHLENQQQNINHEDAAMRQANGGKLTSGDKAVLNHQQNQASKNIYAKKHNAVHTRR